MYRIIPDAVVLDQLAVLPEEFVAGYAAVLDALELVPWNGAPQILEDQREVHMLTIQWVG